MLSSVNAIYFRIDHKLIPVFYRKQKKRKMCWEESGKIPKLKNNFLKESLLLLSMMILIIFFCSLKFFILSEECPRTINHRSLQSGSRNTKSFSVYVMIYMV